MEFWAGYIGKSLKLHCFTRCVCISSDSDQCESSPCVNQGSCEDHIGSYTCTCPSSFTGTNCEIGECDVNNGDCMHFCESMGTFGAKCSCARGYRLMEDGFSCEFPSEEPIRPYRRIVGGEVVIPGEIPWQVALVLHPSGEVFCGGSIVSERWIITAAHCVRNKESGWRNLLFPTPGEHNVHINEGTEQDFGLLEVHMHPRYNASVSLYNHDIALLYLQSSITFSKLVRPICVGPKPFIETLVKVSSPATVSGWGRTRFLGATADTLQKVEVPFTDRTECKRSSSARITPVMFCAGYYDEEQDACQGDSGGPHANKMDDTWFLTGIVSWGEECAKEGKYGVYTRVSLLKMCPIKTELPIPGK
uniref:Coagulation factor IX-like n=1 Tax=Salarias fasciatus TaxID=181472 RepID=A0A672J3J8_SALFA